MIRPSRTLCAALVLCAACASNASKNETPDEDRFKVKAWNPEVLENNNTTGVYLAELDVSLKAWNNLLLTARDQGELRRVKMLEEDITFRATKRREAILEQLESGPPSNRQIAALALGFTKSPTVLSPLLAALEDTEPDVVSNALMGLAILRDPETPLAGIAHHMTESPYERNRSNASWAILRVLRSGGDGSEHIRTAAHAALRDDEPSVRAHAALILAHLLDEEALDTLKLQLFDDVNISAGAASRGLAYIGAKQERLKGQCARALTGCLEKVNSTVKASVLRDLMLLSQRNYGKDTDAWVEWSHRLD
ncbi:MAG: HEAT repeat domain-containing protein [bacterium]|nr:HEAT repeat domain-containing protein [bacterium]